jgi:hypothetical protein
MPIRSFFLGLVGFAQVWTLSIQGAAEAVQLTKYPVDVANIKYNIARSMLTFCASVYIDLQGTRESQRTHPNNREAHIL